MITKIRKRDGRLVDYDITKIENAIAKAMISLGDGEIKDCKKMARITELNLMEEFEDKVPSVEDVQDQVEKVLMNNGYENVAKAYILYRRDHEKVRNIQNTVMDYKQTVDKYLNLADWRVKENSTVTYSVGGLILSNSGAITANYWLSEVYDKEIEQAHKNADNHTQRSWIHQYEIEGRSQHEQIDDLKNTWCKLPEHLYIHIPSKDENHSQDLYSKYNS